jgi:putative spermidine/putrescine transport system permease protein
VTDPAAPRRRGAGRFSGAVRRAAADRAWLGLLPFLLFVGVFLGGPLYEVVHGAFTTDSNTLTLSNFSAVFGQSQYLLALKNSAILSLWTSIGPALFGLWLAAAVVSGNPHGLLRRIVSSASGVLAYFAGLPLAFAFIATIGATGVITVFLRSAFGFELTQHLSIDSLTVVGLAYFYFQIPLMVILISPALEGLRPEWDEAARNLGATRWQYLRLVAIPVLLPSFAGAELMLFGSAFSAYATALALDGGTLLFLPGKINFSLSNNVLTGQDRIAMALGAEMILVVMIVMVGYWFVQRRAGRWLR